MVNKGEVPPVAPKPKPPVLLGDTSGVPLPAAVREAPPKLKGWLTVETVLPAVGVVMALAAAPGAAVTKLKVLDELAPAASGLPPKVKGVSPLGGGTDGEGAAAAPNENAPFPVVPEAAAEGGGVSPKRNPVPAASPLLEGEPILDAPLGCCRQWGLDGVGHRSVRSVSVVYLSSVSTG